MEHAHNLVGGLHRRAHLHADDHAEGYGRGQRHDQQRRGQCHLHHPAAGRHATFSPGGGTYTGSVTVTISDATSGATIYYTTDGSAPTTSSAVYSSALTFTQTTTLKAMAASNGMTNSAVASATYTVQQPVATPAFTRVAGPTPDW